MPTALTPAARQELAAILAYQLDCYCPAPGSEDTPENRMLWAKQHAVAQTISLISAQMAAQGARGHDMGAWATMCGWTPERRENHNRCRRAWFPG